MTRSMLLYRDSCPMCQRLSVVALAASLGTIRRVALSSAEATRLLAESPWAAGKVALVRHGEVYLGRRVPLGVARSLIGTVIGR